MVQLEILRYTDELVHMQHLTSVELCAGAGGQALGYEQAGFKHEALVEIDRKACTTLSLNRPNWNVIAADLNQFDGRDFNGVDAITGGLPCPPFSVAGKQLGHKDDRNLFPAAIRLVDEIRPRAIVFENVRGILDAVFEDYRTFIKAELRKLGYETAWKLLQASDFGVPQLRPRVFFVALKSDLTENFIWPQARDREPMTVGQTLSDLIAHRRWKGADAWAAQANEIAPTIVGGSRKHGGPDLGPTRARKAWAALGVDGLGIADEAPGPEFTGMPRLTNRMVARLQGFPDEWEFFGGKTNSYRQIGNALPPPFARAIAESLRICLNTRRLFSVAG